MTIWIFMGKHLKNQSQLQILCRRVHIPILRHIYNSQEMTQSGSNQQNQHRTGFRKSQENYAVRHRHMKYARTGLHNSL